MTKASSSRKRMILDRLARSGPVVLALDTEFQDVHTLTIQAAARFSRRRLAVQVYRSAAIPLPPAGFDPAPYLEFEGDYLTPQVPERTIVPEVCPGSA